MHELELQLKQVAEQINKAAKSEDITSIQERLKAIEDKGLSEDLLNQVKSIAEMKETLNKVSATIDEMGGLGGAKKSDFTRTFEENIDKMRVAVKSAQLHEFDIVKAAAPVVRANVQTSNQTMILNDIGQLAYQKTNIYDVFPKRQVSANSQGMIHYVDQEEVNRNAATIAEAGTYPKSDLKWKGRTITLKKIGDSVPVSEEMLQDVSYAEGELRRLLEVDVNIEQDKQLWTGDGTGENLTGVYTTSTEIPANVLTKVEKANLIDLARDVKTKIENGKESKYMADTIFLNQEDMNTLYFAKDSTGRPLYPDVLNNIAGLRPVISPTVTKNTCVICDSRYATIYEVEGYNVSVGYVGTQFGEDMRTMKARKRMALLIRNADKDAFAKITSISAALTAMVTP